MLNQNQKTTIFKIIASLGVVLLFVVVELIVRLTTSPSLSGEDAIAIGKMDFFTEVQHQGETYIRITNKYGYSDQNQMFRANKKPNTIRIFCIGGSASAGWPHPMDERFSSYLEKYLNSSESTKKTEVINCSAHGFASYRVKHVFKAILAYEPDIVIVWCGNNEFLEVRRYISSGFQKTVDKLASSIRTVQLLKKIFNKPQLEGNELNVAQSFWKKVQQEAIELRSNPELFGKVKMHYRSSLQQIAQDAVNNNVLPVFMTVPVNLRDWEPNVSVCNLHGPDSSKWAALFNEGRKNLLISNFAEAKQSLSEAIRLEPEHAESYFWLARTSEFLHDTVNARINYSLARDFDYNPFRALSSFNGIVKQIVKEEKGCLLFDADSLFSVHANKGIPGFDLLLDYVHPTRFGNVLLAWEMGNFLKREYTASKNSTPITLEELDRSLGNYSDEQDVLVQTTRFSLCCLTHQYKSAINAGTWILANLSSAYLNNPENKSEIQKIRDGVEAFSVFLSAEESFLLGKGSESEVEKAKLLTNAFYKKYYPYGTY